MKPIDVDKVLFLGTGGGNDVFSCRLAMASLWKLGWRWNRCAIAGVISPFHEHSVVPIEGLDGVSLTKRDSRRHIVRHDLKEEIPFVDSCVARMIEDEHPYGCEYVYAISLARGSVGVQAALKSLERALYKYVVLVDVGGDILFNGLDTHVLSPMFDAMVLRGFTDSKVSGVLFECGPGTDGEIDTDLLKTRLASLAQDEAHALDADLINWFEVLYKYWIEPCRPGRTVPTLIEAYRTLAPALYLKYRARGHCGKMRAYREFTQEIDTKLCKSFFLVNPRKIKNPFAVRCKDPLDWFIRTQLRQGQTNNECSMEYLRTKDGLVQITVPSPLLEPEYRRGLLEFALYGTLFQKICDRVLILPGDWEPIEGKWRGKFANKNVRIDSKARPFVTIDF